MHTYICVSKWHIITYGSTRTSKLDHMPKFFVHIHDKKKTCFPMKHSDGQKFNVQWVISGPACEQRQEWLLISSDRLVRNQKGCDTTPWITEEFAIWTTPVTITSAYGANYQARRSTTSSATSEIAFEPRASTAPWKISANLVHIKSSYMNPSNQIRQDESENNLSFAVADDTVVLTWIGENFAPFPKEVNIRCQQICSPKQLPWIHGHAWYLRLSATP